MSYMISQASFEGPMELLIDLIRKRKMNIYDIEIHVLVDDFVEEIEKWEKLELDITSDFIAMAAWLLKIKSQTLLPKFVAEGEEEEEDPREKLVQRIQQYEQMKELAIYLKELESYENQAIYKKQEDFSTFSPKELLKNVEIRDLRQAFENIMQAHLRYESAVEELEKIPAQDFTFEEAESKIVSYFGEKKEISFSKLMKNSTSQMERITYFLTILELMKAQRIYGIETEDKTDIILKKRGEWIE
ncbi:segregation/condensation protein A [Peptoniphilus sp. KCTC 25270]|uniref:segregation and condensation protein A n=1 Tax=Peptoniphilus sp. KCTC 25270 TaxID=2897414 RepID=UPI001E3148F0|nr:segregation/condensation protein A [Peptoniphilus sp. KCTC 25270]MCD1147139.1 segregation/condensation protein A [Peptoniphilus sp. KCTC 25270]